MTKIILLIPVMILLILAFAFAGEQNSAYFNGTIIWYPREGILVDDSPAGRTATTAGGAFISDTNIKIGNASGFFDGTDRSIKFAVDAGMNTGVNGTFCTWTNGTDDNTVDQLMGRRRSGIIAGDWWITYNWGSDVILFVWSHSNGVTTITSATTSEIDEGHYNLICMVLNYTTNTMTIQGIINDTVVAENSVAVASASSTGDFCIADDCDSTGQAYKGGLSGVYVINKSMTTDEIKEAIFDLGEAGNILEPETPPTTPEFTVTAIDADNNTNINNFTVVLVNSTDTFINFTSTGQINFENITQGIYDITISTIQDGGYHNITFLNYDTTADLEGSLTKFFRIFNITYSNIKEFNGTNYTRILNFSIGFNCPDFSNTTSIDTYVNDSRIKTNNATCTNSSQILISGFINSEEGNFTIYHIFNTSFEPENNNELFGNISLISDLLNPTVFINFTVPGGFATPLTNTSLICSDTIFTGNITYNTTFNDITLTHANFSNGTELINETNLIDGPNFLIGSCTDLFGTSTEEINRTVFIGELILIDEKENVDFQLNLTGARAYFDENQTFFDFKVQGTNKANFSASATNRLRIELIYSDGTIITRYIDMAILGQEIRICANKEGVQHFQQLIVSARQRSTILRNIFADCIVAADSTRFAFQDSFVLQAFTISSLYSLVTLRGGREIILASLDGSLESFINLDTLELAETPFNLNIQPETISFEKISDTTMQIHYLNIRNDNIGLTLDITNMDTDTSVFSSSSFADFNDVTIIFDFSTISNVTNTTLFVIQADSIQRTTTNSFKRYFNTNASSGIIRNELAFTISFLLVIFGLTFTATRITLSWFGVFILIFAIATLSFGVLTPVIIFLMAVETILLVFIFVALAINTYSTLT